MCNMSLGCVGVQVWSTETVDGHEEGQVETCRADGLGAVKHGREAWTERLRWQEDSSWWLTLGDINKQENMKRSRPC